MSTFSRPSTDWRWPRCPPIIRVCPVRKSVHQYRLPCRGGPALLQRVLPTAGQQTRREHDRHHHHRLPQKPPGRQSHQRPSQIRSHHVGRTHAQGPPAAPSVDALTVYPVGGEDRPYTQRLVTEIMHRKGHPGHH